MQFWHWQSFGELLTYLRGEPLTPKLAETAALVAVIYGVHRLLRYYIARLVSRPETRVKYWGYSRSLWALLALTLVVAVWIEELKTVTLLLAGALAGLVITGKELVLGLAGRMTLAVADHYKIGDRIRINGLCGDVINIGLLYTWLLEVEFDGAENQATGRVILVPHLWLTQHAVINATLGHEYVWDEVEFAFPLAVDGQRVTTLLTQAAATYLRTEVEEAARNVPRLGQTFAAKDPPVTPIAYAHLRMETSGHQYLVVTLRYAVRVRARRVRHSALTLHLLALLREQGLPVYQNFPHYREAPSPQEAAQSAQAATDAEERPVAEKPGP